MLKDSSATTETPIALSTHCPPRKPTTASVAKVDHLTAVNQRFLDRCGQSTTLVLHDQRTLDVLRQEQPHQPRPPWLAAEPTVGCRLLIRQELPGTAPQRTTCQPAGNSTPREPGGLGCARAFAAASRVDATPNCRLTDPRRRRHTLSLGRSLGRSLLGMRPYSGGDWQLVAIINRRTKVLGLEQGALLSLEQGTPLGDTAGAGGVTAAASSPCQRTSSFMYQVSTGKPL